MAENDWLLNLCVPELRVADVSFNTAQILRVLQETAFTSTGKQLCLFPQLSLSGSTCADLFFQPLLAQACLLALEQIETALAGSQLSVILGLPLLLEEQLYDAAAVLEPQGLRGFVLNQQPDPRYFRAPNQKTPSSLSWKAGSVEIFKQGSLEFQLLSGHKVYIVIGQLPQGRFWSNEMLVLNPTALPALADSCYDVKFQQFSQQNQDIFALCSAGASESTGEAVLSGLCQVWQNGKLLAEDSQLGFESKLLQFNPFEIVGKGLDPFRTEYPLPIVGKGLDPFRTEYPLPIVGRGLVSLRVEDPLRKNKTESPRDPRLPFFLLDDQEKQLETAFEIQTTALMGRMRHTKTEKLLLGISGGADSSMALLVCCFTLDQMGLPRRNLMAVSMPGPGSSINSIKNLTDLTILAEIEPLVISIDPALREHLAIIGHDGHTPDLTFENAQARERTQILMDLANLRNGLVVGTGDLSENALGWSTYNGDQMSMFNVNAGLPKTVLLRELVWAADMLFGKQGRQVAQRIADAPISPELKPLSPDGTISQSTEEVLGPYQLHDFFLWHIIREQKTPFLVFEQACQVFAGEYEPDFILKTLRTFYQRFFRHQFKRTAAPDGPRIFSLSLSPRSGWRMPADASPVLWLQQLDQLERTLQTGKDN